MIGSAQGGLTTCIREPSTRTPLASHTPHATEPVPPPAPSSKASLAFRISPLSVYHYPRNKTSNTLNFDSPTSTGCCPYDDPAPSHRPHGLWTAKYSASISPGQIPPSLVTAHYTPQYQAPVRALGLDIAEELRAPRLPNTGQRSHLNLIILRKLALGFSRPVLRRLQLTPSIDCHSTPLFPCPPHPHLRGPYKILDTYSALHHARTCHRTKYLTSHAERPSYDPPSILSSLNRAISCPGLISRASVVRPRF